ncbi:hypothetical protein MKX03_005168 [Papaver bracteatum]|nr:hypothetical protein MKX03_005168 [Papaver bracteatum]
MLFSKYLLCILLLLVQTFTSANSEGFTCTTAKTCKSLAGYLVPRPTTLSHIGTLFGFELSDFSYLLGANNLPIDTPPTTSVVADKIIVIPFTCACKNGTGIADQTTRYTVQVGDFLDRIGRDIFSMLVTYEEIAAVNNFSNSNLIEVDQVLWIPLPCSCDDMEGNQVAHYAHVVRRINGDGDVESLEMIAKQFGVTVESLLKLNDGNKKPNAETVLDIPLRACANKVRNTSVDYPLLVANGTYTFTANNCVKCTCDSDNNNSTLLCEPSSPKDKFEYSSPCPSAQCIGHGAKATKLNSSLGKHSYLDDSGCYKRYCAYTGFDNSPIISASLVNKTTCPGEYKCTTYSKVTHYLYDD